MEKVDSRYIALHSAISEIAARCDGAYQQDGVGFNGHDTKFGKRAAEMPPETWNDTLAAEVARILPTYRNQLERYGVDYDALTAVIRTFEDHTDNRHEARDIARQAEYQRKHAPYIKITGNSVAVYNSFPIKDELKRNGFKYNPNTKSWDSPLNGQAAVTIKALGVSLTDEQKPVIDAQEIIPTEQAEYAATKANIDICLDHPDHLQLETEYGVIPLQITRAIPGRKWDGDRKVNHVSAHIGLYQLAEEFNLTISDNARALIETHREEQEAAENAKKAAVADSYATETDMRVALHDYLRKYQRAGVAYAITHGNTLNADEMGLGKTAQALSVIETTQSYPCLVVCPPSLVYNWAKEIRNLLPDRTISVYQGRGNGCFIPKSDIHIVNYVVCHTYLDSLPMLNGLVLDESHYIKNPKAQRTKAIQRITGHAYDEKTINGKTVNVPIPGLMNTNSQVIMLTGTPVLNRPRELIQPLIALGHLNPLGNGEGSVRWFLGRFCVKKDEYGNIVQYRGHVDYNGADHLDELHMWLRATCMVGRTKKDVLDELPAKIRSPQFIVLDSDSRELYERLRDEGAERAAESRAEALVYLNALRQAIGESKIQLAIDWINDFLETGKSLVVFADHKKVQHAIINALRENGHNVVQILGGAKGKDVEEAKRAFQAKEAQVIVLSLTAGREGHTLTAASDVLMVQQGWNPGTQDQAEDRCHRIGQTDSVTAWYLIAQDTIDEWMYELVEAKRKIVNMVNRGMSDIQDNESIFSELLARVIESSSKGGSTRIRHKDDEITEKGEEKVIECEECREINLCTESPDNRWLCSECIIAA